MERGFANNSNILIEEYRSIRQDILKTWAIVSVLLLIALVSLFILQPETIRNIMPRCELKSGYNKECSLCGMTTSFLYIANGKFREANASNSYGIALFSLLIFNEISFVYFLAKHSFKYPVTQTATNQEDHLCKL